jgi:hypothetical protein
MKRTGTIAFIAVLAILFLSSEAGAQEKKEQQKIKIVVADDAGTKVVIDTMFTGNTTPDSITLKDGNVIYIKKGKCKMGNMDKTDCKEKNIYLTVSDDEKGDKKIKKEITVIAGDSAYSVNKVEGRKVIVMSDGKGNGETSYNVTVSTDDKGNSKGKKNEVYYYVNADKDGHKGNSEKFNIEVSSDEPGIMEIEKSSYVIAKDGIVVTIEGGNEEKVKELAAIIESKLGVKKNSKTGKK